jgi:hypothetical protein
MGAGVEEVREHLVDLGVLLPVLAFGILFGIPEAECQDTIPFGVRRQHSQAWQPIPQRSIILAT